MPVSPIPSGASAAHNRTTIVAGMLLISAMILALVTQGCRTAPVSGRKQLVLIPEAQEIQMGVEAYDETLAEEPISTDKDIVAMVERVGRRIAAVANKPDYDWEFRVIAKDVQNAFALPGGKVAVYEGILPVCQSEAGLAVVMSHEVAHALARHGGERMSQQSVVTGVGSVINAVSQRKATEATTEKVMQVYGASSKYGVILPFSRKHESEADAIGLILMAKAGYDPSVAPEFWERFAAASGSKPPEWLSTHPADARRAADLRALLPEAMKYYETAEQKLGMGAPIPVRSAEPAGQSKVQLASGESGGPVSAFTGSQSGNRGYVDHALYTEVAKPNAEQASAEDDLSWAQDPPASGNFQLPVKAASSSADGASTTSAVESIDANGWSTTKESNPFE